MEGGERGAATGCPELCATIGVPLSWKNAIFLLTFNDSLNVGTFCSFERKLVAESPWGGNANRQEHTMIYRLSNYKPTTAH